MKFKSKFSSTIVRFALLGISSSILLSSFAFASDVKLDSETKSKTKLDFDGAFVEGMNKRPLDSLMQISDADKRKRKAHLYHKRDSFKPETAETIQDMRYN